MMAQLRETLNEGNFTPATLYWLKLSRKNGSATFTPHLIHEASGVGTNFAVIDLNKDRRPDIVTSARRGTWLFLNKIPTARR